MEVVEVEEEPDTLPKKELCFFFFFLLGKDCTYVSELLRPSRTAT